jgi:hypothetical protein
MVSLLRIDVERIRRRRGSADAGLGPGAVLGPVEDGQPVDHQLLGRPLGPVFGRVGGVDEGADHDGLASLGQAAGDDLFVQALRPADAVDADQPVLAGVVDAALLEQPEHGLAEVVGDLGVGRQSGR